MVPASPVLLAKRRKRSRGQVQTLKRKKIIHKGIKKAVVRHFFEQNKPVAQDLLEGIVHTITDGITVQEPSGKLSFANAMAAHIVGYPTARALMEAPLTEIMGKFDIMDSAGRPLSLQDLPSRKAMRGEHVPEMFVRFRVRATGEERWSVLRAVPVIRDGKVRCVINIFHDVTQQKRSDDQAAFIAEASSVLASSLDYTTTLKSVAQLIVLRLADWCSITMQEADGSLNQVAVAHKDPEKVKWAETLRRHFPPDPSGRQGVPHVLRTGISEMYSVISEEMIVAAAKNALQLKLLRKIGLSSAMIVPLVARGKTLGALTFVTAESGFHYDRHDLVFAEDVGKRIGLAIDNTILFRAAQEEIAERARTEQALRDSESRFRKLNDELETRIQARTSQLQEEIAERRSQEEKANVSLQRMKDMISNLPMGALAVDEEGMIIHANDNLRTLFGEQFATGNILNTSWDSFAHALKQLSIDPQEYYRKVQILLREKQTRIGQEFSFSDGRTIERDYLPIFVGGVYRGHLLLYRDVTQEKRVDAAKSEFMSLASHQLRTPLTTIRWIFGRLAKKLREAESSENVSMVEDGRAATERMSYTIDTMLQISRLESGQMTLRCEKVRLCTLLEETAASIRGHYEQKKQNITVHCAGSISLFTDANLLKESIANILSNAMKYSPEHGEVTVTVAEDARGVSISVEDTGYGIPLHEQGRIFGKFYRGESMACRVTEGSGLGLYLVSLIMQLLDGTITCESLEGKGTTFTMRFPTHP